MGFFQNLSSALSGDTLHINTVAVPVIEFTNLKVSKLSNVEKTLFEFISKSSINAFIDVLDLNNIKKYDSSLKINIKEISEADFYMFINTLICFFTYTTYTQNPNLKKFIKNIAIKVMNNKKFAETLFKELEKESNNDLMEMHKITWSRIVTYLKIETKKPEEQLKYFMHLSGIINRNIIEYFETLGSEIAK